MSVEREKKNLTLKTCAPDFSARSMTELYAKIKGARAISLFDFPKTWQVWWLYYCCLKIYPLQSYVSVSLLTMNLDSADDSIFFSPKFQNDDPRRNKRTNPLCPPAITASVRVLSNLKKRVVLIDCSQSN